ncbi:MAG TPA: GNAT family N-acetyltransferase [Nocardioidaceae bacterium]|nr:GNAT family N-acetyltransferase [Nocardioidaceae bacterium]
MSIAVRAVEADDAPRLLQIYVESWNAGFGELMPHLVVDEDRISRWTTELTAAQTRWWVAEFDGSIAGFVGIGPSRDPIDPQLGELDTIAVSPALWRKGIGSALMRTALDALADAGFTEAIVWTLAASDQGQAFYDSMGWTRDGRTRDDGDQVSFRHDLRRPWPDQ